MKNKMNTEHLWNALLQLRQSIKETERIRTGRAPVVCDDEALKQILKMRPQKLGDFEGITGIGSSFIQNYAASFLEVIEKYADQTSESVKLTAASAHMLRELEKKLVNINRRNRLLYLPKISKKFAFDLFGISEKELDSLLFGSGSQIVLCDVLKDPIEEKDAEIAPVAQVETHTVTQETEAAVETLETETAEVPCTRTQKAAYRSLVQLLREVFKELRETGQNELYIGYPFAIGQLSDEEFEVRAPLVLFPVSAEKTGTQIHVSMDYSRDILVNTTLLLAHFKFAGITKPLPENSFEDCPKEEFLTKILTFFNEYGLQLQTKENIQAGLQPFTEFRSGEFPAFRPGELYVEPCAVLGKYPVGGNAIQKDFSAILESSEINPLLEELLLELDGVDYFAETPAQDELLLPGGQNLEIREEKLQYIHETNTSQENVLAAVQELDALVIQGPPGTGKSQTIVNLIAQAVSEKKTILMVSEKKTALDVVYSRLGELSRYALQIDDVGNKNAFYQQLTQMTALGAETFAASSDTSPVSEQIEATFDKLDQIFQKLTTSGSFGIAPHKLYLQSSAQTPKTPEFLEKRNLICIQKDPTLFSERFDSLQNSHKKFSDREKTEKLKDFRNMDQEFQWMDGLRTDLTEIDVIVFSNALKELGEEIRKWRGEDSFFHSLVNLLLGWFTKRKFTEKIQSLLSEYFTEPRQEYADLLERKLETVLEALEKYAAYQEQKSEAQKLTEQEKRYFNSLLSLRSLCRVSLTELNTYLYCALLYEHIVRFEAGERELFQNIRDFEASISLLDESFEKKRRLTRQNVEQILANGMQALISSKRRGDILRLLESKRKWSVRKFIQKYDFELFRSVRIWLMTPEVVSELIPLQIGIFDLVIFDEASQMYVERGLPSILRGKKVVVAGDHKQLRPSSLGAGRIETGEENDQDPDALEITAALEEESLLDLARFRYPDVLLNFHYRSRYSELIEFSNAAFYHGRLHVSPNVEIPDAPPIEFHRIHGALWTNRSNLKEAEYVVEYLKRFFRKRQEEETIGIITFNSNQRELIEDIIDRECMKNKEFADQILAERFRMKDGEDIGFFVKNIESVQGDERDVILFSVGYAQNEKGKLLHNFGWLNQTGGENRLNVAISRAKKKIHVVCSFDPSELHVETSKNPGPIIFKKYLEYAMAVNARDSGTMRAILRSFSEHAVQTSRSGGEGEFRSQVYEALTQAGFEVECEVGVGEYRIDLALKEGEKYILGIECDSWADSPSSGVRERDYHRQKYLRSRGWKLCRIWSSDWWRDPANELDKIVSLAASSLEKSKIHR